jgi:hypothetical protein
MKWLVAGAGALLTLVGLYFLLTGYSIVQVERGWALFIVGGTLFSAGSLLMGMAALIARLDAISVAQGSAPAAEPAQEWPVSPSIAPPMAAAAATVATAGLAAPMLEPRLRPEPAPAAAPSPEPEPAPEPEPVPEPVAAPIVELPLESSAPDVEPPPAPAPESPRERPEALRNFKFVFPPLDTPELTAPAKGEEPGVRLPDLEPFTAPPPPPVAEPKNGLLNLSWLRRAKPAPVVPALEPAPLPEPEPAIETAPEVDAIIQEAEAFAASLEQAAEPPVQEAAPDIQAASIEPEPDLMPGPSSTGISLPPPLRAEEPSIAIAEKTPEPFSDDWLERALAGDEPREPPPPRFIPPSMRRAALEDARQDEEEQIAAPPVAPPVEEQVASAPEPIEPTESAEIGRYKAGDVSYIMYADGSIAAETANGTFRFSSLIELKDFIERGA